MKNETRPQVICFGEVLWDILPHAKLPGGAPMNVAYHLNQLGKHSATISRIGNDELGKELTRVFESKNIDTRFFQIDKEHPTGTVFAEVKEDHEVEYDIVKPVAWDYIEWKTSYADLLRTAEYFVFGSLVTRDPLSKNTLFKCLEMAKNKILDVNLRPPHFDKSTLEELLRQADILKLNIAELHLISEWFGDYSSDEDCIKSLCEKFDIRTIIATKGDQGAVLFRDDLFFHHEGYKVKVADTVGSGDAFLAAMISQMIDNSPAPEMLDFACKLGAFVASRSGGCPDYQLGDL